MCIRDSYFPGVPVSISAIPRPGYKFKEWKEIPDSLSSMIIDIEKFSSFEAVFDTDLHLDEEKLVPLSSKLKPAYPNPFNNRVTIPYDIHIKSDVSITISNVLGQKIASFSYSDRLPGNYKVRWNGNNDRNMPVSGGVYLVTLKTPRVTDFKKIILLK